MYHHSRLNQHADEQYSMMRTKVTELTSDFLNDLWTSPNIRRINQTTFILGG